MSKVQAQTNKYHFNKNNKLDNFLPVSSCTSLVAVEIWLEWTTLVDPKVLCLFLRKAGKFNSKVLQVCRSYLFIQLLGKYQIYHTTQNNQKVEDDPTNVFLSPLNPLTSIDMTMMSTVSI